MISIRKFLKGLGIIPKSTTEVDSQGELEVLNTDGKLRYHNGTSVSPVVTEAHSATLTNKTIDADSNTISNIENADIKTGAAIDAAKIADGSVSNTEFQFISTVTSNVQDQLDAKASASALQAHLDDTADAHDASAISNVPAGSIAATDVQAAINELDGDIQNHLNDTTDAHDASAISSVPSGNLAATDVQGALNELQTDVDSRALSSSLTTHTGASSGVHGVTGSVVGTTDSQTLTNKTLTSPIISSISNTGTLTLPTSTDTLVGRATSDTLTNKTLTSPTINTPTTDIVTWDDQASTPSNPSSGFYKTYFKNDGNMYKLDSAGNEASIGAGGLSSLNPVSAKTSNYTITSSDNGSVIPVDTTSGAITITLPAVTSNFKVTIKDVAGTANTNNINVFTTDPLTVIDDIAGFDTLNTKYKAVSYHCNGTKWIRVGDFSSTNTVTSAARGVFGGGDTGSLITTMQYINIASPGNSTSFGNLATAKENLAACASATRGLFGGGSTGSSSDTIEYITIASVGNATSFGNLTVARRSLAGLSNSTIGVFGGGYTVSNVMDYVTIATTGNATDFGDLTSARGALGACASTTRGVFAGGDTTGGGADVNTMDYITIASAGNATSFGNLSVSRFALSGCSSATRGLFAGGDASGGGVFSNVIDYITIASTGNATDFGDLTVARRFLGACSNPTTAVFGGGQGASFSNVLDYVTIASAGNATDFGDLLVATRGLAALSNGHGGI